MHQNWKQYKIGEIGKVQTGPFGSQLHQKDYVKGGIPLVTVKNIGSKTINRNNLDGVSEKDVKRLKKYILRTGDIVYSRVGANIDRSSLVTQNEDGWVFSSSTLMIRLQKDIVNPEYIIYSINTPKFKNYIRTVAVGATRPSLNTAILSNAELQLPPLPEQTAIASILSTIDAKIENNLAINKTLEEMAMALYKEWFVDFGPFQDGKFVDSELGMIPEGWEVKSIYNIATYVNGAAFKSTDFTEDGDYVIKIAELRNGISGNTKKSRKIIKDDLVLQNGSVLFSWSATLDVFLWDKGKALLNQHIFNVIPNGVLNIEILYFILKYVVVDFQNIAKSRATTMGHIKLSHLKEYLIAVPSKESIKAVSNNFAPIYFQILENKVQNQTLTTLRDTLLPKLISGEVRLNEFANR